VSIVSPLSNRPQAVHTCVAGSVSPWRAHSLQTGSSRSTWVRTACQRADPWIRATTGSRRARLYSRSAWRRLRIPASVRGFEGMRPRGAPAGIGAEASYHVTPDKKCARTAAPACVVLARHGTCLSPPGLLPRAE
jgi:hypothetical protein